MSEETTALNNAPEVGKEVNTISLEKAQRWAKRWAKKEGHYNKHHHLQAFLIPKADLLEVLVEGIDAARAYIGVHKKHDGTYEEKLMIVGTKFNPSTGIYEDMIDMGDGSKLTVADSIYDFTQPCPPYGDSASPLNA